MSGFSNGMRLAIIASQVPFVGLMIERGGGFAIVGYIVGIAYIALALAIVVFMFKGSH